MLYVRALKETLLGTALPYGFTVTLLGSSQVLIDLQGRPNVGQVFLFSAGAAAAYGVLRVTLESVEPAGTKPSRSPRPALAGALHTVAIGGGIGAAALVGLVLGSGVAWLLGGFLALFVYLLTNGVDVAVHARIER